MYARESSSENKAANHFVKIEPGCKSFDWVVKFIGSGAPGLIVPVRSTEPLNQKLNDGWKMSKTLRLGIRYDGRMYVDFLVEKDWEQVSFVRTSELDKEKRSITMLQSGVVRRGNR